MSLAIHYEWFEVIAEPLTLPHPPPPGGWGKGGSAVCARVRRSKPVFLSATYRRHCCHCTRSAALQDEGVMNRCRAHLAHLAFKTANPGCVFEGAAVALLAGVVATVSHACLSFYGNSTCSHLPSPPFFVSPHIHTHSVDLFICTPRLQTMSMQKERIRGPQQTAHCPGWRRHSGSNWYLSPPCMPCCPMISLSCPHRWSRSAKRRFWYGRCNPLTSVTLARLGQVPRP